MLLAARALKHAIKNTNLCMGRRSSSRFTTFPANMISFLARPPKLDETSDQAAINPEHWELAGLNNRLRILRYTQGEYFKGKLHSRPFHDRD